MKWGIRMKLEDLKEFAKSKAFKVATAGSMLLSGTMVFAEDVPAAVPYSELATAITSQFKMDDMKTIVTACLGAGIPFTLAWFAVRKVKGATLSAFKSGKLKA